MHRATRAHSRRPRLTAGTSTSSTPIWTKEFPPYHSARGLDCNFAAAGSRCSSVPDPELAGAGSV